MNNDFKRLQKEWYDKLKASGFKDIENGRESNCVWQDAHVINNGKYNRFYSNVDYYRQAGIFLHHFQFESPTDRAVWDLHTNGCTFRDIAKRLNCKVHVVLKIVHKLRDKMLTFKVED